MKPDLRTMDLLSARLPALHIVVAGDVMLDRFAYGVPRRLSPEAPVPVLPIDSVETMPGGAGNVVANLQALGVRASLLSVVGSDRDGQVVRALLKQDGAGLVETPSRPTIVKTRFVADGRQMLRADIETAKDIEPALEDRIVDNARTAMAGAHALVLSDYRKGVLTRKVAAALIALAKTAGIPVLADPKGHDYTLYRGADVLTPNLKELAEATGLAVDTDESVVTAARQVIASCGIGAVVVTRSQDGMTLVTNDKAAHFPAEAEIVRDVSGAGDTVIAAIAAFLAAGATLDQGVAVASGAAGLAVARSGTCTMSQKDLQDMMAGAGNIAGNAAREAPVLDRDAAAAQIRSWKAQGLKVGFTNGCFDILHAGHANYLNSARDKCDRLVLGLNSDASVRRLKGPERPVNDQDARATVMAALGAIDLVVLFGDDAAEDDKPVKLVEFLRPDILFKGGDYTEDQLPEARAARAYGGSVLIMPLTAGRSTTSTISRIRTLQK